MNASDAKIRDSRFQRMGTTMVLGGNGHLIVGNHRFRGDNVTDGPRVAGLVLTETNIKTVITGTYIDHSFIEWRNEHAEDPDLGTGLLFGGLTITGNIFTCNDVANRFFWLIIKPFGADHKIRGLSVTGNTFKSLNRDIDRIEKADGSIAPLDASCARNITFSGNGFNGISQPTFKPATLEFNQLGPSLNWQLDVSGYLPFGGCSREVDSVVTEGPIINSVLSPVFLMPYVTTNDGLSGNLVRLTWPQAGSGRVHLTARTDRPI